MRLVVHGIWDCLILHACKLVLWCNNLTDHFVTHKVFDESALSQRCKEEMYKCYPDAKRAHLKSGGNFPYLSRSSEVNLMIQVMNSS